MNLHIGTKLGPYEVQALLGAGGMGEVYRARDTRLDRTVAIKILPQHLTAKANVKQRFEREARAISSLQHPNICTLFDVGHQDGTDFLVMEFLEGETLADRLAKGPLALEHVLKVGIEICEGLETAHRSGVVHRDLKPGNIMLTKTGAKLLDFGLAKPLEVAPAASLTALPTSSKAMEAAKPVTAEGTIVGTFQYMSPEQLEGKEADERSDIFALGSVLYEMATGKRAFEGKSQTSVIAAILEREPPPISSLQPMSPPQLDHVVKLCLAKDPDERLQSAHDVKLQLKWLAEAPQSAATKPAPRKWLAWTLAVALALAALTLAATYYGMRPAPESLLMASIVPPPGVFPETLGRIGPPQISPGGESLAFAACKTEAAASSIGGGKKCSVWVQPLDSTDAHEVAGTAGGYFPFWSPDGREIAFFADGKLKRTAADGGPVQIICDAEDGRGGSWGSSGTIIFAATRGGPIFRVSPDGGAPVAITRSTPASNLAEVGSHRWPHFLPDGQHFLYNSSTVGSCNERSAMHFASLDGKQDVSLMPACSSGDFAAGRLIYWRDGNLVAQLFDPRHGVLSGAPVAIVAHVAFDSLFSLADFSASADGKLVYVAGEGAAGARLIWYDRTGKMLGTLGDNDQYQSVAISPDGSRVVAAANHPTGATLLILDARGARTLMTLPSGTGSFVTWSADGRQVYFTSNENGPLDIFVKDADGSGDARKVVAFEKGQPGGVFPAASPDGKFLAYVTPGASAKFDIYTVALKGDLKPHVFVHSAGDSIAPVFSPNAKWLAYESTQSGRSEVYITPFPAGGAQYQVSTNGGERPVWRRDGKEIFYRENLTLMAVGVNPGGGTIRLGTPKPVFEVAARNLGARWYDVSPDGRFLVNGSAPQAQAQNFGLVVNWPAALHK
ncbi:MAG TPA: LpqB family beta-propeller domain-containing protein [Candidatus Acidoferrales bacterium]|nr:LpqB family beta-propeller domain-containing protein [Candidatus Acidoferrales bacterium]